MVGSGVSGGKVLLYLRDVTVELPDGHPTILAIQTRTGFIAAHPVAPGSNPYFYAEQARSSGL